MRYEIEWIENAMEDLATLFEYLAENASLWDANDVTDRILHSTDKLTDYPRLYTSDERYGAGVRRISLLGQHVLYEVDDTARRVTVLAVVGQRQNPKAIR
ncbi:type II toxin-antitoxin system RelE/ParE family toxin [Salmonella enterica]|uniref:Type II toxin-antitoxin system RelE/ParE family toxin n=1 Tax=Salmonella enterica I TaxID=59201 RepID=A0A3T7S6R3_SALET|nr:type II toxin-antitoxin system RelE/ParE family toxin [Salmonella enterica subsp. enterica serovar Java]EAA4514948.1 type II toxin-antitoxin system RelE/ParE family toxin [Salmonella enterica subsp. enterica serovar Vitkin]EAA4617834.1 type II toxin-antitoxin system RelE/ParE family toxin [Salmonella enterica subsp. enterica serovar Muenchen]EAB4703499.1 type II toxin-antitoxin system RelE/ParE family toxin [Salmonella enterica]EDQ3995776.1 type II toxin-antitoxin system RelE/ParE family tox